MRSSSAVVWAAAIAALLVHVLPCSAADYRVRRQADGFTFDMAINRNPPALGRNEIRIEIRSPEGAAVVDAEVAVNYSMPPMPNMAPMNYTVPAPIVGQEYRAAMELIMTGPWNIVVRARVQGRWIKAAFPIDVR